MSGLTLFSLVTVDEDDSITVTMHDSEDGAYQALRDNFLDGDLEEDASRVEIIDAMETYHDTVLFSVDTHYI